MYDKCCNLFLKKKIKYASCVPVAHIYSSRWLESWGIKATDDFGEIVYNLIEVDLMKKSEHDRREDFDGVFDFDKGLTQEFKFTTVDEIEF